MSSKLDSARKELELIGMFSEDDMYGGMLGKAVMELLETFVAQGHSGMSASYTAHFFKQLADNKPLSPLTGEDDEWVDTGFEGTLQNKRCSSVFKYDDGTCKYIDAIIFKEGDDSTFTGSAIDHDNIRVRSSQVITFPFVPKSFYVDVVTSDDKHIIVFESQVDEAIEYCRGIY